MVMPKSEYEQTLLLQSNKMADTFFLQQLNYKMRELSISPCISFPSHNSLIPLSLCLHPSHQHTRYLHTHTQPWHNTNRSQDTHTNHIYV
jgi:hypothetical protein